MRDGYLRGALARPATQRQMDVLAAYVADGGSIQNAAELVGIQTEHRQATPRRPTGAIGPDHRAIDLPRAGIGTTIRTKLGTVTHGPGVSTTDL